MDCRKFLSFVTALFCVTAMAAAQNESHNHMAPPKPEAPKSEARQSFDAMKTLAGEWEGKVVTDFPGAKEALDGNDQMHITLRVTSRGNVLVHEMQQANTPLDFSKYDHPVTMFYVNEDKLDLVHYCDAGNRPRMIGTMSPDGKTVEFEFADLSGSDRHGHMEHAVFKLIDDQHHIEDWTFRIKTPQGEKPIHAVMELHRKG